MRLASVALVVALAACGGDAEEQPRTEPEQPSDAGMRQTAPDTQPAPADTQAAPSAAQTREGSTRAEPVAPSAAAGQAADTGSERPTGRRLYTVQIAAFLEPGSAEEWTERIRNDGWPVWSSLAEVRGRMFHRVRIGALPTVDEARRLGNALSRRYGWPVWLAPVTPVDQPPADVVEATRQALNRG